jgi:3-hydroxyisobutyrate dehydrogenase-like beta-hydroxyacid dehydrogenase
MRDPSPVGLVGIGLMGQALAERLFKAGKSVQGFDIDPAKGAWLTGRGGTVAGSLAEVARQTGPILLAVFSTDQVEDVVERHIVPALGRDTKPIVICTSTCDPDRIAALGQRIAGRLRFLEVPVSGTSEQVRRGEGVALIGGDPAVAAEVSDLLDALFASRFHIGQLGDGGRAKLAVNLILGLNRLALAEGLVFASRLGLDQAALLDVARNSAAYSQVMETKGPKMVRGDFAPEGRVSQALKDVHLMLEQARAAGQRLPLTEIYEDVLAACVRHGEGDMDNSRVIEEVRRRTGALAERATADQHDAAPPPVATGSRSA